MALLIRSVSRRLTRQPQRPLEIDRGTRAGQAISNLIPFGPVNRDVVTGAVLTLAGGGSSIADPGGLALRGSGASAAASIPLDLSSCSQIALSFWLYWDAYANNDALAMEHGTNFGTSHGFLIDPNSGAPFSGSFQVGVNGIGRSFTRPTAAGWHHYLFHLRSQGGTGSDVNAAYVDGVAQSLSSQAGGGTAANFGNNTLYLFSRAGSSLIGAGRLRNLIIRPQFEATPEEIRREFEKPWALYRVPARRRYVQIGGASTLSLTPDGAALTLTGYAPAVTQTTTLDLMPGAAVLALTGYASTVTLTTNLTPDVGVLTLTGYAPTVTQSSAQVLTPNTAGLSLTGYAPSLAQTAVLELTPTPAVLTFTGWAPTVSGPVIEFIGQGSLGPHYGDFWGKAAPRARINLQKKVKREVQQAARTLEELPGPTPPNLQALLARTRQAAAASEASYSQLQELRQQLQREVARQQRRRRQQHLLLMEL